jgi:hypothetical protein
MIFPSILGLETLHYILFFPQLVCGNILNICRFNILGSLHYRGGVADFFLKSNLII